MAKKKIVEKIRIHNKGKRDFTIPPSTEGGKNRLLPAGRAIEIEADLATKMIEAYPNDLIEFDSLVSGEKKDLKAENATLTAENETLKARIAELEGKSISVTTTEENAETKEE